jgi:GntR family transcriptional regulator
MRDAYGSEPVRASERLSAVAAGADAAPLGVRPGAPLLLVEREAVAADGVRVERARDLHRGAFVVERR